MADPITRPPDAVIERPTPAPAAPVDDFETKYRARLKQDTGHDDPSAVKTRLSEHERYAQTHPQYEAALRALLLERQQRAAPTPTAAPDDEDAKLEELGRINPVAAARKLIERERESNRRDLEQVQRNAAQYVNYTRTASQAEADAGTYLGKEFPEVYQAGSDLHTEGLKVYQSLPGLQQTPDGFRYATEIAASRLGLAPKSKRRRAEPTEVADDVAAQNVGRPSKRRESDDDDEPAKLTPRERQMAENSGVDPKVMAQAKARRAKGQNVVVR